MAARIAVDTHISDGKRHEFNVLNTLPVEVGAFYVMERGYLDFDRPYHLHQSRAFFVTLANKNARTLWALLAYNREYEPGYGMVA